MSEWINVEDRLPASGSIVFFDCEDQSGICIYTDGQWIELVESPFWSMYEGWVSRSSGGEVNVNQWHPLPAPPTEPL